MPQGSRVHCNWFGLTRTVSQARWLGTQLGCPGAQCKDFVGSSIYFLGIWPAMELRPLRFFIAVAEAGSPKLAAEKPLHTAQPSLSRQIRDLEHEVGVPLLTRSMHGVD